MRDGFKGRERQEISVAVFDQSFRLGGAEEFRSDKFPDAGDGQFGDGFYEEILSVSDAVKN